MREFSAQSATAINYVKMTGIIISVSEDYF